MTNIEKCLLDHGFEKDDCFTYQRENVVVCLLPNYYHPELAGWQVGLSHSLSDTDVKGFGRDETEQSFLRGDYLIIDTFMDLGALEDPWGEAEVDK